MKLFIKACRLVNPNVDADVCYRAYKIVKENLRIKI